MNLRLTSYLLLFSLCLACSKEEGSETETVKPDNVPIDTTTVALDTLADEAPSTPIDYYSYLPPSVEAVPRNIYDKDSIWISNYNLIFKPAQEAKLPLYYPDQKKRDSLTVKFPIDVLKALAIEKYLLQEDASYFGRSKDTLKLYLQNGRILALTDQARRVVYHFENYFPDIDFYLIRVQFEESSGYLMVKRSNGAAYPLWGRPYFSPSKQQFVTLNSDLEEQVSPNGMQLFTLSQDGVKKVWDLPIRDWGPTRARWISENKLFLEISTIIDSESDVVISSEYREVTFKSD